MDRYFTRFWNGKQDSRETRYRGAGAPFTQLIINDRRFYGGPAGYFDRRLRNDKGWVNEEVLGQKYDTLLKPGQELSTFVCTDPRDDDLQKALEDLTDKTLLWQVQVRRGAVDVNGRVKPATAVFAVSFADEDINQ